MIEWSLRFGDLMVVASFIGTIGIYIFRAGKLTAAIDSMQKEIIGLKDIAKVVADVLTTVAVQKVELSHLRGDVEELKHGIGFKKNV